MGIEVEYKPCTMTCEVDEAILDQGRNLDNRKYAELLSTGNSLGALNQLMGLMALSRWQESTGAFSDVKADSINTTKVKLINDLELSANQLERLSNCADAIVAGACRSFEEDQGVLVNL